SCNMLMRKRPERNMIAASGNILSKFKCLLVDVGLNVRSKLVKISHLRGCQALDFCGVHGGFGGVESTSAKVALVLAACAARADTHAGSFSVSHCSASRSLSSAYRLCAIRFFTSSNPRR